MKCESPSALKQETLIQFNVFTSANNYLFLNDIFYSFKKYFLVI